MNESAGILRRVANVKNAQCDRELQGLADEFGELLLELEPTGRFTYANVRVTDLLGYEPDEFLQIDPQTLAHPDDQAETNAVYASLLMGELDHAERTHRARRKDGSYCWLQDSARAFMTEEGERRVAVHGRDITAHREAEIALEHRLEEQIVITRLSRSFLGQEAGQIHDAVMEELATVGKLAGCDRLFFLYLDPRGQSAPVPFRWSAEGVEPHHADIAANRFLWSEHQLLAGQTVHVPRVADLPSEANEDRRHLQQRGVLSLLTIPVLSGGDLVGLQVFECTREVRSWSEHKIGALGVIGEIFATAIRRGASEIAHLQSEERFRTIAEQATELVAEFDAVGRYCYVSPSYETLLGYAPESLLGEPADELIHPDDQSGSRQKFERSFRKSVESHSIHRLLHSDGRWRWFQNSGQSYLRADGRRHFVSIGHDITERVEAQSRLETQLELERTAASLSRRLLGLRGRELTAEIQHSLEETAGQTGADRAYLGTFQQSPDESGLFFEWCGERILGGQGEHQPWAQRKLERGEIIHVPDIAALPESADDGSSVARQRGARALLAIPVRSADTSVGVIGFECHEARTWTADEITLLGLIGEILTNALHRQSAEMALLESQHQLAQSQKLEAVGRLAGGIAHDFNNLLTVILGLSRPILQDLDEGTEMHGDVRDIHDAAERAAALTRQLLTFSRRQPVEDQFVDLDETLENLRPLLARMLGEDVELQLELGSERATVRGDAHQFEQIVVNLAANARDARPSA
jgi:PAS domain S-box-containing protein